MKEMKQCPKCEGCGKVANTREAEPWHRWESLPPGSDLAVRLGIICPIPCPKCNGTGKIETEHKTNQGNPRGGDKQ